MSAWVLPDHIADVLPSQARHIEELRRTLLDTARTHGYELVMPPMVEHLDSLLTGTGEALDLQTFKLVDQISGRTLGLRADSTPQVARIDAHLLNRQGVARLSYCGPVVHTRSGGAHTSREPLQFGAEIYGHAGLEADLEVLELAQSSLQTAGVRGLTLDLADVRVIDAVLAPVKLSSDQMGRIHAALAAKDSGELRGLSKDLPAFIRTDLIELTRLYGDVQVLDEAQRCLTSSPLLHRALADLRHLANQLQGLSLGFDMADLRGYAYYTGVSFAFFAHAPSLRGTAQCIELARGGRYDEVGAVFGRKRPAVGFSLDLKHLVEAVPALALRPAVRAPWGSDSKLRAAIAQLRAQGHTVVCVLPGHEHEVDEFQCDRELVVDPQASGGWSVKHL